MYKRHLLWKLGQWDKNLFWKKFKMHIFVSFSPLCFISASSELKNAARRFIMAHYHEIKEAMPDQLIQLSKEDLMVFEFGNNLIQEKTVWERTNCEDTHSKLRRWEVLFLSNLNFSFQFQTIISDFQLLCKLSCVAKAF